MKTKIINFPDLKKAANRRENNAKTYNFKVIHEEYLRNNLRGRFYIRTYGCQANVRDEESMGGILSSFGMIRTEVPDEASIIIINTCAVRENAEDKVYGEIGNLKKLRKNKNVILAVCGCMIEQPEILEFLIKTFPEVNLYFGTHEIGDMPDLLYECLTSNERIVSVESKSGDIVEGMPCIRSQNYKAFVNIMYGCDKFCTYCIVPYTRGKERSRSFKDIMAEVKELKSKGYQEITFLGQNVNAYGKDLQEGYDFADVLEHAAKLEIPRIRFTTSHPWDFSEKMIDIISKYDNIMKCIHLPVQSGSSEVLKRMNRRYDREKYLDLVKLMREKIPGLSLSTDIIVGFPNETDSEFEETLTLVDLVKYESAFTFIYSPRRGTPAAKMKDDISLEIKSKRFKELVKHLEEHISRDSNSYIGKTYKVLVDTISKTDNTMVSGYTESNKLVHFKGNSALIGKIVNVKITESHTYSLIGENVDGNN